MSVEKFLEIIFNYAIASIGVISIACHNLRGAEVLGDFFRYAF